MTEVWKWIWLLICAVGAWIALLKLKDAAHGVGWA